MTVRFRERCFLSGAFPMKTRGPIGASEPQKVRDCSAIPDAGLHYGTN